MTAYANCFDKVNNYQMSFLFTDAHINDYYTLGYTVFRGILPPALITDLRRVTDQAREIARASGGGQVQRLQPVSKYEIDQQPFKDFGALPELHDAITRLLGANFTYGTLDLLGVLLEPAELPWCTAWHRDWRDNMPGLKLSQWDGVQADVRLFNQVNCALYEDTSTWVVPGSHLRRDLPGEVARFPERPIPTPQLEGKSSAERERLCLEYCQSMPGAVQLHLDAGDFALYRNTLWHIGNYVPYRKRATLHDAVDTVEFATWREKVMPEIHERRKAGIAFENPNPPGREQVPLSLNTVPA